ncbi:derlin-1 [Phlebotomus argentipes]|uniref:derlin-1 n=1 Tax=Phlebotomus argentipes TaxID=94469 RepID=UPI002892F2B5|nr:derlin-1 [Phlebotomus argentipes]
MDFSGWFNSVPIFTRYWLSSTVIMSLVERIGLLPGEYLILLPFKFVYTKFQIWRPLTSVLFYPLTPQTGFHFMLNCYFLYNYSVRLEREQFKNTPADHLFMLIFNWANCVILGVCFNVPLLMDPMVMSVLYVWCKLNADTIVNFWFGTQFKAAYLPWVLLGVNLLLSSSITYSLIGIVVGHLYYSLKFLYPTLRNTPSLLETPQILKNYFPDVTGGVYAFGGARLNNQPRPAGGRFSNWGSGHRLGNN